MVSVVFRFLSEFQLFSGQLTLHQGGVLDYGCYDPYMDIEIIVCVDVQSLRTSIISILMQMRGTTTCSEVKFAPSCRRTVFNVSFGTLTTL